QREWAWRVSRGEPLHNLRAFEHIIDKDALPDPGEPLPGEAARPSVADLGAPG
ncbi:MAG TPA: YbjN domain-containing protein, partial [Gordonia sp. (in: high G+C Gram-positive bacteria)]|nr:YbjN domain-containing protein [Gordonia sp. (in: high G+C Gram-positive bacteria)]